MKVFLLLLLSSSQIFWVTEGQRIYNVCVTSGSSVQCDQLKRESPNLRCVYVEDSIECANLLQNGSSGFGIFSAETTLLLAALNYNGLTALKELRHRERTNYTSDYESVVVVKANHSGGIDGLKGLNYCHPGLYYDHSERCSERFLKHFERTVTAPNCNNGITSQAEIEVAALANLFSSACRPGAWSNNAEEDSRLKSKYPQLCELCSSTTSPCEYDDSNRHAGALRCLLSRGQVAYVFKHEVQDFFGPLSLNGHLRSQYAYLCPDGTLQLITDYSKNVCTWLQQPWPVIISSGGDSVELSNQIDRWIYSTSGYEKAIRDILTADDLQPIKTDIQKPRDIFYKYRPVPYAQPLCSTEVSWCTKSLEEKEKCELVRTAGITTGVYPLIKCQEHVAGAITCLKEVNEGKADFTSIDSNLGYIARHQYNLTAALYTETDKHSSIVIVVRADSTPNLSTFYDLRSKKVCIPEFNGLASLAFIKLGKEFGYLPKKTCNHTRLLSEFFGESCVPGAHDSDHNGYEKRENLCSLCPQSGSHASSGIHKPDVELINTNNIQSEIDVLNNVTRLNCNADSSNSFFGDRGALFCLAHKGEVAILKLNDLNEHAKALAIDPHGFRILCRNGSLADRNGFDVEPDCAIGNFVDGEIVVKHHNNKTDGIINALLSLDKYLKDNPNFKMYKPYKGHKDLLFNNVTIGLNAPKDSDLDVGVENYKKLFEALDACSNAFQIIPTATIIMTTLATAISVFLQ